jgi:hypothetical protein
MYPQDPHTCSVGLTAANGFHRLTLIKFPAPPASRVPGTRTMSLDWHFGHLFVFFIDAILHPATRSSTEPTMLRAAQRPPLNLQTGCPAPSRPPHTTQKHVWRRWQSSKRFSPHSPALKWRRKYCCVTLPEDVGGACEAVARRMINHFCGTRKSVGSTAEPSHHEKSRPAPAPKTRVLLGSRHTRWARSTSTLVLPALHDGRHTERDVVEAMVAAENPEHALLVSRGGDALQRADGARKTHHPCFH